MCVRQLFEQDNALLSYLLTTPCTFDYLRQLFEQDDATANGLAGTMGSQCRVAQEESDSDDADETLGSGRGLRHTHADKQRRCSRSGETVPSVVNTLDTVPDCAVGRPLALAHRIVRSTVTMVVQHVRYTTSHHALPPSGQEIKARQAKKAAEHRGHRSADRKRDKSRRADRSSKYT